VLNEDKGEDKWGGVKEVVSVHLCKISLGVFRVRICVRRMFQNLLNRNKPEKTRKPEFTDFK